MANDCAKVVGLRPVGTDAYLIADRPIRSQSVDLGADFRFELRVSGRKSHLDEFAGRGVDAAVFLLAGCSCYSGESCKQCDFRETFHRAAVLDNFPKRDAVDARVIKTVQTGKAIYAKDAPEFVSPYVKRRLPADSYKQGIITDIRQVGGLPEYKGEAVVDSDGDGMPDAWEVANGLNPNDPADANMDCNGDGYTNIEKYINGIDTRKKVDWTDLKNNYDTLSKRKSLL